MAKLSVVINTLNEERNLPEAILSIKPVADEIVVVDMHSKDKTAEIAQKNGARVYKHKREGYVEPARNFGIEKAKGEWILILDADERLPRQLSVRIKKIIVSPKGDYYRISRKNIIFGKWMKNSRWWPDYNVRLFKKGKVTWNEVIHSVPMTEGVGIDLPAKEDNSIIHNNYRTVEQYIERMNRYTSIQVSELIKQGETFSWPRLITAPTREFLSRYFQGEGYKDGVHGLAISLLQAFSEVILSLKLWQAGKFKEENVSVSEIIGKMKETEGEFHYWWADALIKKSGGLLQRVKRRYKLG